MMKTVTIKTLMMTTALVAVVALPAQAESPQDLPRGALRQDTIERTNATHEQSRRGMEEMKRAAKETAADVRDATVKAARKVEAAVIGATDTPDVKSVTLDEGRFAKSILGKDILDANGKKQATVRDVIIDEDGNAKMIVVSDGGFLGIGDKLAAFDYADVVTQRPDGTLSIEISENMVKQARPFTYEPKARGNQRAMEGNAVSVSRLMDSALVDPADKKLADVENIYISHGEASRIVIGFDKKLGLGGKKAVIDLNDVNVVKNGSKTSLKLSAAQTATFKRLQERVD